MILKFLKLVFITLLSFTIQLDTQNIKLLLVNYATNYS